MGRYNIKVRLMVLCRKQRELLEEIRKRGYLKLQQPALNSYINGGITTPQAEAVLKLADEIIREWETGIGGGNSARCHKGETV